MKPSMSSANSAANRFISAFSSFFPTSPAEKIPAIIIVHGSGGVRPERELAYAREFQKLGVAAVVVDSFAPRGIKTTTSNQDPVSSYDMLVDAVATLKVIARHPAIDPARIGMIGFSKGGTVVVKAALQRYMNRLAGDEAGFALLVAMYPWCGDQPLDFRPANSAPLYMLLGANDTYAGVEPCREFGKKFESQGGKLVLKVYPGAQHGWDTPGNTDWHVASGENLSKCRYDEIEPGKWIERGSKIVVTLNNRPTPDVRKARGRCMTHGVSGGYNANIRRQSMEAVRSAVRSEFHLN
jgi:dienelactone hydrolase